jgi:hypothetical protein
MERWQYRITVYTAADIQAQLSQPVEHVPPQIFCDDEGACYFDPGRDPLVEAMEHLLDDAGEEGWELVQVVFRPEQMICFWKRSL